MLQKFPGTLSWLAAALALGWILVVGGESLTLWPRIFEDIGKPQAVLSDATWLLLALVGWMLVLALVRARHPRLFYTSGIVGLLGVYLLLLITSQQWIAGLALAWLGFLAWSIGFTMLDHLGIVMEPISAAIVALSMGLGILALLTLSAGLVGQLSTMPVLVSSVVLAVLSTLASHRSMRLWGKELGALWKTLPPASWWGVLGFMLVSIFLIINWCGALAPDTMFDSLKSHLALARIYATAHWVSGLPHSMGSYWPMNGEMLFSLGYLLGGEATAKLFHFAAGLAAAGMIYGIGKQIESSLTGWLAAIIFYTTPIIVWESTTAYVDLFLAMYVAGALFVLIMWLSKPSWQTAAGIGIFLGLGLGVKPTGAYFAIGIGLVMVTRIWLERGGNWRNALGATILTTTVATLIGGVWYLRAFIYTGNPVFPFLNGIFHSPLWYNRNETFNYGMFGFGTSLSELAWLPWRLTFETEHFVEVFHGAIGVLFLAFIPLAALTFKRVLVLLPVIFVTVVFGFLWAFSVQYLRYLIPALVGGAVVAGWGVTATWHDLKIRSPILAPFVPVLFLFFTSLNLPLSLVEYWNIPTRVPYDVVLGRITREQYRAQVITSYKTYDYADKHLGPTDRIFGLHEYLQYLVGTPMIMPFFSLEGDKILRSATEESALDTLEESKITHLIVNRTQPTWRYVDSCRGYNHFLTSHAVVEYVWNNVYLYRLIYSNSERDTARSNNLIKNESFEEIDPEGKPTGWNIYGQPLINSSGTKAHSGKVAVRTDGSSWLFQDVPATAGKMYILAHWTRADHEKQWARLQINWLDSSSRLVGVNIEPILASSNWTRCEFSSPAPDGSTTAQVYTSVHGENEVWFDDISLIQEVK